MGMIASLLSMIIPNRGSLFWSRYWGFRGFLVGLTVPKRRLNRPLTMLTLVWISSHTASASVSLLG